MLFRHRRLVCRLKDEPRIVPPTNEWSQSRLQPQQQRETQAEQTRLLKASQCRLGPCYSKFGKENRYSAWIEALYIVLVRQSFGRPY